MPSLYIDSRADTPPPLAAVKNKVENRSQYDEYLSELQSLRKEYGVPLKEDMYPDDPKTWKNMS